MVCPCGSKTDGFSVTNTLAFIVLHGGPEGPPYTANLPGLKARPTSRTCRA
jgi:hypothetical protein